METWKKINGFEDYQISNLGRVKSLKKNGERILKERVSKFGYIRVMLQDKNIQKEKLVHRLVALHFIPNTENKPYVNHINNIKNDNKLENLEWCTALENMIHSIKIGRNKKGTKVVRYLGNEYKIYNSIKEASLDNNICASSISQCLKGKSKTANNFNWKYLQND